MKKKKYTTPILVIAALILWAFIGKEVFSYVDTKHKVQDNKIEYVKTSPGQTAIKNYELSLDYEDPFLENFNKPKVKQKTNTIKRSEKAISKPKQINCVYNGIFKKDNKRVLSVRYENKNLILNEEKEIEGLRLIQIYKDSALIEFEDEVYIIFKSANL